MNRDTFGKMILEMASERDALAKAATILETSHDHDDQQSAELKRERIQGLHDAMRISIRYFGNDSDGMTFEMWKSNHKAYMEAPYGNISVPDNIIYPDPNPPINFLIF